MAFLFLPVNPLAKISLMWSYPVTNQDFSFKGAISTSIEKATVFSEMRQFAFKIYKHLIGHHLFVKGGYKP